MHTFEVFSEDAPSLVKVQHSILLWLFYQPSDLAKTKKSFQTGKFLVLVIDNSNFLCNVMVHSTKWIGRTSHHPSKLSV